MSSLYSDPSFSRGTTLLNGEVIEYSSGSTYSDQVPVAGAEIVGQVKVFQDINPVTKDRYSNELVYCVAARFKPASATTVLNSNNTGADKGKAYVLRMASGDTNTLSTAEFTSLASAADSVAGERVGFLDEYLNSEVRANDIVWLVIKGPVNAAKATGAAANAGSPVALPVANAASLGLVRAVTSIVPVATTNSENAVVGQAIGTVNATTGVQTLAANAASGDTTVRVLLNGINWGV